MTINPMSLTPQQIVALYRTSMSEAGSIEQIDPRYDIFQLKYDGWWVAVKITGDKMQIITSGADVRKEVPIDNPTHINALLIGEWMYGTNWSGKHNPGRIFIHDVVYWDDNTLNPFSHYDGQSDIYDFRLQALEHLQHQFLPLRPILNLIKTYPINQLAQVYQDTPDFEGVVLKSNHSGLGVEMNACKIKRTYTEDYVVMRITEGGGRLLGKMGALEGGQYFDGALIAVCSVGGGFTDTVRREIWENQDKYIGRVFEAYGKARFDGGALRHPNFKRWRDDKAPTQCVRAK